MPLEPIHIDALRRGFLILVLCMARLAPIFHIVPFLGGRVAGNLVRNGFAMMLSFFLFPMISATVPENLEFSWSLVFLGAKEICIGLVLAFEISMFFWAAEGAGKVIDQQREIMSASKTDQVTGESSSPIGNLLAITSIIFFVTSGGLIIFFEMLFDSYRVWPVFSFIPHLGNPVFSEFMSTQLGLFFKLLVIIFGPMSIACFLSDFGLGIVARAAPQLNVFEVSMPLKSFLVHFVLIAYMGTAFYTMCANPWNGHEIVRFLGDVWK